MRKKCNLGKSCGATCIDRQEGCVLEFGPGVSTAISQAREAISDKINGDLLKVVENYKPLKSDKETISYLENNYKKLASEGMEQNYYGGPGQRGSIRSKVWMIGQEAAIVPERLYPGQTKDPIYKVLEKDPVALINSVKLHKELYESARKTAPKQIIEEGVKNFYNGKDFKFGNTVDVPTWKKEGGSTYYGKLGRMLSDLGYKGGILGANISSLTQPPGQKGSGAIASMLKRNGIDPNKFAEGAFANKNAWYNFTAKERAPRILEGIQRLKPKLVYMGEQGQPEKATGTNFLMYQIARNLGQTPYHYVQTFVNSKGKEETVDVKYFVIDHGKGKRTVIFNGPHPTGPGFNSKVKQNFVKDFIKSLETTGKPPTGIVPRPVSTEVINKLIAPKNAPVAKVQPQKVQPVATTDTKKVPMKEWDKPRLIKAYERAMNNGDEVTAEKIQTILSNK
jgi:hypothetical protein